MIESTRFHKVGDKKVNEIEGFPKKVNIYIELIDFWGFGPLNHFEKSTQVVVTYDASVRAPLCWDGRYFSRGHNWNN